MNTGKWSSKDVVEIVGVLGVIVSLIFVAFQIRQDTRAIESSTIEAILSCDHVRTNMRQQTDGLVSTTSTPNS